MDGVRKVSAVVHVSKEALEPGLMPEWINRAMASSIFGYDPHDTRTPEQRELDRLARAAETQRIHDEVQERHTDALAAASGKLLAVLELHAPTFWADTDRYAHCDGCDFGGYEGESPEWPCRTYELVAGA